uniref:Integrase core domain containing protein n=1 Tax=Solanum tuberosum TaxID=4113 RepID=M1DVB0_SOLTU
MRHGKGRVVVALKAILCISALSMQAKSTSILATKAATITAQSHIVVSDMFTEYPRTSVVVIGDWAVGLDHLSINSLKVAA